MVCNIISRKSLCVLEAYYVLPMLRGIIFALNISHAIFRLDHNFSGSVPLNQFNVKYLQLM